VTRKPIVRIAAAIAGGLFVAVALLALLVAVNAGTGFRSSTGTTPLRWTIPLVAGALVGAVAWLLLADEIAEEVSEPRSSECHACGAAILDDWRLCPYCGGIVSKTDDPAEPQVRQVV